MHKLPSSDVVKAARDRRVLTLRGVDPALRAALEAEAARLGTSLNTVILRVLRASLGLTEAAGLHHGRDELAGVGAAEESRGFNDAVRRFEEIEPSLWGSDPAGP